MAKPKRKHSPERPQRPAKKPTTSITSGHPRISLKDRLHPFGFLDNWEQINRRCGLAPEYREPAGQVYEYEDETEDPT
ncbi:MAG: hypothetical protein Q9187_008356, partial [Circinaria calcarea]